MRYVSYESNRTESKEAGAVPVVAVHSRFKLRLDQKSLVVSPTCERDTDSQNSTVTGNVRMSVYHRANVVWVVCGVSDCLRLTAFGVWRVAGVGYTKRKAR